jgi:hypothetical protein
LAANSAPSTNASTAIHTLIGFAFICSPLVPLSAPRYTHTHQSIGISSFLTLDKR